MQRIIACEWLAICTGLFFISENIVLASSMVGSTTVANPIIKTISPQHCFSSGGIFRLNGVNFGSAKNRELAIIKNSETLLLRINKWTNTYISVQLPKIEQFADEVKYTLVIIEKRKKSIISNRSKTITICGLKSNINMRMPMSGKPVVRENTKNYNKLAQPLAKRKPLYRQQADNHNMPGRALETSYLANSGLPQPSYVSNVTRTNDNQYEHNELVVISKDMARAKDLASIVSNEGYRIKRRRNLINLGFVINVIGIPEGVKISTALKQLHKRDQSLVIDVNHRYSLQSKAIDQHNRKVQTFIQWGKVDKECGKGVTLGIIDSLVDTNYSGFRKRQIINKSFLPLGIQEANKDHATAIASIIASQPNANVMGLLPAATIYAAGVFRKTNDNRVDTTAELIINGLNWLDGQKVNAINMSIAGPRNLLLVLSIERLLEKNILIAASVGNGGLKNISMYPAAINGVVGVTAVDSLKRVFKHANQGEFIQIAAPGVDIWAARAGRVPAFVSGTSFASPYIAASLAVLRKKNPSLSIHQIIAQLIDKTEDLGVRGVDTTYGSGLLQFTGCL